MAHIKREIAVLRWVRHPHIVQLYEVMATKLRIYFVMEYVRGGELFARGRLREADARRYFQHLVSSVAFCHARGVYHRDIKPENLLVDDAGDLKVSDFGLSAVADQMRHDGLFHTFCGTPAYVAPEVLSRRGYDAAKADLWCCGVVLAAGYLPFQDRNLVAMYRKIHRGEFRCPKWFSPELTRLLDTNPQRRATANEIMDDEWFKVGFRRFSFRPILHLLRPGRRRRRTRHGQSTSLPGRREIKGCRRRADVVRVGAIAATAGIAKRARREQPAAVEPERVRHHLVLEGVRPVGPVRGRRGRR